MERAFNIRVWKDTKTRINRDRLPIRDSVKYTFSLLGQSLKLPHHLEPAKIHVFNADTFDIAYGARVSGQNPLVLNMANHLNPGGGVESGARAQEECLFRRSNYSNTLTRRFYPIRDNEVVYSPVVSVIKDSGYDLSEPWQCACIAVAALRMSPDAIKFTPQEHDMMEKKIRMMFRTAIMYGHDSLVLGAFGCGAFNNPPIEVCNIFDDVMGDYLHHFKDIYFAVLSDDDNPNYDIFKTLELLN